jgi:hypothetical protein
VNIKRLRKGLIIGVLVASSVAGCSCSGNRAGKLQNSQQSITEDAFAKQQNAEPYPLAEIDDSTERANLIRRLIRFNDPNRIGYVYVFNFGKVVGYYVIKGKVTSNESQLTSSQFIVQPCSSCDRQVVDAPQDDGSYGGNETGVFFFTTANILVETDNDWLYADEPLPIDVPLLGGDVGATESAAQLAAAEQAECRAVGKAAGINLPAGQQCTPDEISKLVPKRK